MYREVIIGERFLRHINLVNGLLQMPWPGCGGGPNNNDPAEVEVHAVLCSGAFLAYARYEGKLEDLVLWVSGLELRATSTQ